MIKTPEDAAALSGRMADWRALLANPAWRETMAPRLAEAAKDALAGLTSRSKTPEQRAEFLEAYHILNDLAGFAQKEAEKLESELREWGKRQTILPVDFLST